MSDLPWFESNAAAASPASGMQGLRRGDLIALLCVLFVAVLSYVYTFEHKVVLGVDNAGYYLLGKALASGAGYVSIWLPDMPPHNHWPPGYPLIISIIVRFIDSVLVVKLANGVFLLGALSFFFRLMRRVGVSLPITTLSCMLVWVLGEVAVSSVDDDGHDPRPWLHRLGHVDRSAHIGAGRHAAVQPFLPAQSVRHPHRCTERGASMVRPGR